MHLHSRDFKLWQPSKRRAQLSKAGRGWQSPGARSIPAVPLGQRTCQETSLPHMACAPQASASCKGQRQRAPQSTDASCLNRSGIAGVRQLLLLPACRCCICTAAAVAAAVADCSTCSPLTLPARPSRRTTRRSSSGDRRARLAPAATSTCSAQGIRVRVGTGGRQAASFGSLLWMFGSALHSAMCALVPLQTPPTATGQHCAHHAEGSGLACTTASCPPSIASASAVQSSLSSESRSAPVAQGLTNIWMKSMPHLAGLGWLAPLVALGVRLPSLTGIDQQLHHARLPLHRRKHQCRLPICVWMEGQQ